ncbi:hypothetical protein BH20ACT19_BH20ACT19_01870 [soil metagenome]
MATFADTSALFALLDRDDAQHERAATVLSEHRQERFMTHNYVVLETLALTQARLGMRETRQFLDGLLGLVEVVWVTAALHASAVTALLASGSGAISFVDRVSFALMREQGVRTAFAFDRHFRREGFALLP